MERSFASDLLAESAFAHLGRDPLAVVGLLSALLRGKAALKAEIAAKTVLDVTQLPYDDVVVTIIRKARAAGNPVYLASASNERYVRAVADHLGLFDGCFGSTDENLSSAFKARRLVEVFGKAGFDYIGNERADLAVWAVADRRTAVRASPAVKSRLRDMDPDAIVLEDAARRIRPWLKLLRVHQWAKNSLVFVPLVTAQRFPISSHSAKCSSRSSLSRWRPLPFTSSMTWSI